jgi:hypothetical protein
VQFALLLVVWVKAELAAELAKVAVHVDAILAVRADESLLVDVAQRRRAGRLRLVDVERSGVRNRRLLQLMVVNALWHKFWCSSPVGRRDARLFLLATDLAVIWFGAAKLTSFNISFMTKQILI